MAHPELVGDLVQPFTLAERQAHARLAVKQLGSSIPWIVDTIDNKLKHALGDRPNSEFIIDPKGVIVRKRSWSHPGTLRTDLEQLVGKVDRITREEDVKLAFQPPPKSPAVRGVVERIPRPRMQPIVSEPTIKNDKELFLAKLRAEGDADLFTSGSGKLYLGFHLDPLHDAHWNNLQKPLRWTIEAPESVKLDKRKAEAVKPKVTADADPREFLLTVEQWPADAVLKLTVEYSACIGDEACHTLKQTYTLSRRRDRDGGGARSKGAGLWETEQFTKQLMAGDKDKDGKLSRSEVMGLVLPHFDRFDRNRDGYLQPDELGPVAEWLNTHHRPGAGPVPKK